MYFNYPKQLLKNNAYFIIKFFLKLKITNKNIENRGIENKVN